MWKPKQVKISIIGFVVIEIVTVVVFIIIVIFLSVAASILFGFFSLGLFLSGSDSFLFFIVFGSFVDLLRCGLCSKFSLFLEFFLSDSLFLLFFLFLLLQNFLNCGIFFTLWPSSSGGIDLLGWLLNHLILIEFDIWTKSSEEVIIQELLDETSELSWCWINLVLESQSQFEEQLLKLMVN